MSRYRVEFSKQALEALRETAAHIVQQDGPERAAHWLRKLDEGKKALETLPRGFVEVGTHEGRPLHSKLIMKHRVYYFIDDTADLVVIIDVVHTRRQTKRAEYHDDE